MSQQRDDVDTALMLLRGLDQPGPIRKTVFPSAKTDPTEKEARIALARSLLRAAEKVRLTGDLRLREVLYCLACLFDEKGTWRRVVFKHLKQGRGDDRRDYDIADLVYKLSKVKGTKRAISEIAEMSHLDTRTVERIYAKNKKTLFDWNC
jgi:hypothetical protein